MLFYQFHHWRTTLTREEVTEFYMSREMATKFGRCFNTGVNTIPERLLACLVRALVGEPLSESSFSEYTSLVRAGVLIEHKNGEATFSCPAAAKFINAQLFPNRAVASPTNLVALMKNVLQTFSCNILTKSVVDPIRDFPPEAIFQHQMLSGLQQCTSGRYFICPDLGKYFPPWIPSVVVTPSAAIGGRCDFYLNGPVRWGVEALIYGKGVQEHISRFESEREYEGLDCADYIVVDFRMDVIKEEVTKVKRNAKRMSVFFQQGNFSQCTVQYGEDEPQVIQLSP